MVFERLIEIEAVGDVVHFIVTSSLILHGCDTLEKRLGTATFDFWYACFLEGPIDTVSVSVDVCCVFSRLLENEWLTWLHLVKFDLSNDVRFEAFLFGREHIAEGFFDHEVGVALRHAIKVEATI